MGIIRMRSFLASLLGMAAVPTQYEPYLRERGSSRYAIAEARKDRKRERRREKRHEKALLKQMQMSKAA